MATLAVQDLTKSFGRGSEVLRGVSFTLEQGETVAVIGSSGSGKTTLLRCINFLETPDGGTIRVNGRVVFDAAAPRKQRERELRENRLHFGLVFQNFNLFPQYTALRNVTLAAELLARQRGDAERLRTLEDEGLALLERVGLREKAGLYPHQLRRAAAARGHCAGTGDAAGHSLLRRADECPRPGADGRGAARAALAGRAAHDDARRHA